MLRHERAAFLKFFIVYFGSVALLILAAGFFYFEEQKKSLIEKEHFSIIEYTRQLKMNMNPQNRYIKHKKVEIEIEEFTMQNFTIKEDRFEKYLPYSWEGGFMLVTKEKTEYKEKLFLLKRYIILVQILLLCFFASLSYFLALKALRPMRDAITKLDNFSKDLIHDLNTPITSILLNIRILEAKEELAQTKALWRIKESAQDISKLHLSLTHLLHEETMIVSSESIFEIVDELVVTYKRIFPSLNFYVEHSFFKADINREAFKQVLTNLLSNACKYNKEGGYVKIYKKDDRLCIENSGATIENPQQIFERSYKEHRGGHGIGLDIVKRLCDAMSIRVEADSKLTEGSRLCLEFRA